MNVLVFEDEVYTFRLLRKMLVEINGDCNVVGPISTVEEGRAFFAYHHDIDLIIADIQLGDGLSFDALCHAPADVPIIFTTAYDEYALKAFEYNSLSYLLKPVSEEQLAKAMDRARRLAPSEPRMYEDMRADAAHRHCFLVNTPRGERRVPVSMARYAVSENKTTYVHLLDGTSHPLPMTLDALAAQLNPKRFMRVNRKYIVPVEQAKAIERLGNGRMRLLLYGDDCPDIIVSRTRRREVCKWLGM